MEIKPTCTDGRVMSQDVDSTKSVFFSISNSLNYVLLSYLFLELYCHVRIPELDCRLMEDYICIKIEILICIC